MVIAAGAPPTVPPPPVKPPVPFTRTGALIAVSTCAGVMPATMLTVWPLIVNVPPFAMRAGQDLRAGDLAAASADSVAPKPVILAGAGEPATGLAEKVFGSISSEPGTLVSCAGVSG